MRIINENISCLLECCDKELQDGIPPCCDCENCIDTIALLEEEANTEKE